MAFLTAEPKNDNCVNSVRSAVPKSFRVLRPTAKQIIKTKRHSPAVPAVRIFIEKIVKHAEDMRADTVTAHVRDHAGNAATV